VQPRPSTLHRRNVRDRIFQDKVLAAGRMPTERKIIEELRGMFREKFARDWGPGDPVWFDPDQNEAMRKVRRHRRSSTFIGKQVGCSWRGMTQDEPAIWLEGMERRDR